MLATERCRADPIIRPKLSLQNGLIILLHFCTVSHQKRIIPAVKFLKCTVTHARNFLPLETVSFSC